MEKLAQRVVKLGAGAHALDTQWPGGAGWQSVGELPRRNWYLTWLSKDEMTFFSDQGRIKGSSGKETNLQEQRIVKRCSIFVE